jgi:hypothetical protein
MIHPYAKLIFVHLLRGNILLLMQLGEERYLALKNALFMHQLKVNLDREALKMVES